jgi:hypothetical protein
MVTKCALKLTSNATFKAEPTLHQLDIRDEGHGIFQACPCFLFKIFCPLLFLILILLLNSFRI